MKRSLSLAAIADSVITNRPTTPNSQNSQAPSAEKPVGLFHLIENNTPAGLKELLDSSYNKYVRNFVREGRLPDKRTHRNDVAFWLQSFNEPKLLLELLKFGNVDIPISSEEQVTRLLNALNLEPATQFQNIAFCLALRKAEDIETMLPPLIDLIQANNFCDEIKLELFETEPYDLGSLYDALSGIRNLKLSMVNNEGAVPKDLLCRLVKLLEKNKTVHTLDLKEVEYVVLLDESDDDLLEMLQLLRHQTLLEVFRIAVATPDSKQLIGKFIENSHSIRDLTLDIRGAASAPSLIEGLKKNTSLKVLKLRVDPVELRGLAASSAILPLISLFEKNKCSVTELTLDLSRLDPDEISSLIHLKDEFNKNRTVIENLLASNTTLKSLTIIFPDAVSVDLFLIAKGLTRNRSLESLHFQFI